MIVYFSGTGNCKYIAQKLGKELGDNVASLRHLMDRGQFQITLKEDEDFGFVCPTYWEALPTIVVDFLERVEFHLEGERHYNYFVAAYGNDYGNILSVAQREFSKRGLRFDSCFALLTAGNWRPYYELKNPTYIERILKVEAEGIQELLTHIRNQDRGLTLPDQLTEQQLQRQQSHYEKIRATSLFRVDSGKCISCGLCARQCPVHAIEIKEGLPAWVKEKCTLCLGCLSRCPAEVIDYEEGFLKYGRYVHPGVGPDSE